MGIIAGSATFCRFFVPATKTDPLKGGFEEPLRKNAAPDIESASSEKSTGWVAPTHLLDTNLSLGKVLLGDWLCLVLRSDSRSVPSTLLKAYVEIEMDAMSRGGKERVSKTTRLEVTENVREKLMQKVLPRIAGTDVAWNVRTGEIFLGTQSPSKGDVFAAMLKNTFGLVPQFGDVRAVVERCGGATLTYKFAELLPFDLRGKGGVSSPTTAVPLADEFIGREFLTWLWFSSETNDTIKMASGDGVSVLVADYIVFSTGDKEGQRSTLKKGEPTKSGEAFTALNSGRMLEKAKVTVTDNENEWAFTLSSDHLGIAGLKLPKSRERHPMARIAERCESISALQKHMDNLLLTFLEVRCNDKEWTLEAARMLKWMESKAPGTRAKKA